MHHAEHHRKHPRGALLLVVLSMLLMFLMLGSVLVTHATRSRTAAMSFAEAVADSTDVPAIARDVLDEALLQLIRGTPNPDLGDRNFESLLADKYSGLPVITGTAKITNVDVLITVEFTPLNWDVNRDKNDNGTFEADEPPSTYLDLGGRILTFLPTPAIGGSTSSYRIIRAAPANSTDPASFPFTCYLANISTELATQLPPKDVVIDVVINNPEFPTATAFAEPYDSFQSDFWLTGFQLSGTSAATPIIVTRSAFRSAAEATPNPVVDNDGDGVPDGEWRAKSWVNKVFPPPDPVNFPNVNRILPSGAALEFDISYMVTDLDSRLNVNAHGSLDRARLPIDEELWGEIPQEILDEGIDAGFGWGVADLHLPIDSESDRDLSLRLSEGMPAAAQGTAALTYLRESRLPGIDGRYGRGPDVTPGISASLTAPYDEVVDRNAYQQAGQPNPLVDLKGVIKVFVDTTVTPPALAYRMPPTSNYDKSKNLTADPYELSLNSPAARNNSYGSGGDSNSDNLFSLSELERVLRLHDSDANLLPQRLAAILGDRAKFLRMLVTTDSWDTPSLTGAAADKVRTYYNSLRDVEGNPLPHDKLFELLSPDLVAGLRFDINRPFATSSPEATQQSKQDFCRHLYCLIAAIEDLPQTAEETLDHRRIAQWVANVCDYRDDDSAATTFVFDTDLTDGWGGSGDGRGWNPGTQVVLGTERPVLAIAETYAWRDSAEDQSGLFVTLYRPAGEVINQGDGDPETVPLLDESLTGPNGQLDLCRTIDGDPIWRLRYDDPVDGESYVRFDSTTDGGGNTSSQNTLDSCEIPPDGFVCVFPSSDPALGAGALTISPDQGDLAAPDFFRSIGMSGGKHLRFANATSANDYKIHLERVANPAVKYHPVTNPYVVIDSFDVKHESKPTAGNDAKSYRRCPKHFWLNPSKFDSHFTRAFAPIPRQGRGFLLWPNRPFISQAELALVPTLPPAQAFTSTNLIDFSEPGFGYLSEFEIPQLVVDATIVSSRYRGTSSTFNTVAAAPDSALTGQLALCDLELWPYRQLSKYREPGRVNVNTIPSFVPGPNLVARAVLGRNGSLPSFDALKTEAELLGLGSEGGIFYDAYDSPASLDGPTATVECICAGNDKDKPTTQRELFPLMGLRTAIRLGNVATVRSNVFAVWITVRIRDTTSAAETTRRLFAIVDRSIPTAFSPGQDINVRNVIRVKRFIE